MCDDHVVIARIVVVGLAWLCLLAPAPARADDDALAAQIRADIARGYDVNVLASCAQLTAPTDDVLESCTIAACRTGDAATAAAYARAIRASERVLFVAPLCTYAGTSLPASLVEPARAAAAARERRGDRLAWLMALGLAVLAVIAARWGRRRDERWPLAVVAVVAFANTLGAVMSSDQRIVPALASGLVGAIALGLAQRRRASAARPEVAPVATASEADEARLDLELARMDGRGELPPARARKAKRRS